MNWKPFKGILFILVMILPIRLISNPSQQLEKKYEKWIKEEVLYIITPAENDVFYKLESDRERDLFIEEFWRQRDPTPGTPRNEFKEEHFRRIEYANKKFGRGTPIKGWRTDRGRFYIKLGNPGYVEKYMDPDVHPIEIWYYTSSPKFTRAPVFRLLFFQRHGSGEFELYNPVSDGPASLVPYLGQRLPEEMEDVLVIDERLAKIFNEQDRRAYRIIKAEISQFLADATISSRPGDKSANPLESQMIIGDAETIPQKKVDDSYAYEFLEHKAVVEVSYSVNYMGNRSRVNIIQDPSGMFFVNYILVPETLSVDFFKDKYFAHLKISVRVTDGGGKTIFQGERNIPVELRKEELKIIENNFFQLHDSFPLIPGNYTFDLLFENLVSKEFTSVEKKISVPEGKYLQMSQLVLARKINRNLPPSEESTAFRVGDIKIYPSVDNTFLKGDNLFLFFQIYGLNKNLKENGYLEFSFFSEEQNFQRITRDLNQYKSDREFLSEVSLEKFEPGIYSVVVALRERSGREVMSQRETISVTSKTLPGSWIVSQTNPSTSDPFYTHGMGMQFLNKGDIQKAHTELAKAYEKRPEEMNYALGYARVLLTLENYPRVREILVPFAEAKKESFELFFCLGKSSQELSQFEEAITYYQKALTLKGSITLILNSIGECYLQLGENEQALKAFEKSLETDPSQESIRKKIDDLKKHQTP
ncbi:GWxTD domain-containing protein [Acidobacteriota bacterium]